MELTKNNLPLKNSELSILDFNQKVLEQAGNGGIPILERIKFLGIVAGNIDEFEQTKFANLKYKEMVDKDFSDADVLSALYRKTHEMYDCSQDFWRQLKLMVKIRNINIVNYSNLSMSDVNWCRDYFLRNIYPNLDSFIIDDSVSLRELSTKSLNVVFRLSSLDRYFEQINIIQVPEDLPQIIQIPDSKVTKFIFLDEIIKAASSIVFPDKLCLGSWSFRILRNRNLKDDDTVQETLKGIKESKYYGLPIILETERSINRYTLELLKDNLKFKSEDVFLADQNINLKRLMKLYDMVNLPELKFQRFEGIVPNEFLNQDTWSLIRQKDRLLMRPYDNFAVIVSLYANAAMDPDVKYIYQTLYRSGKDSPIVEALCLAARNGKQVNVVLEYKAQFDEEENIDYGKQLEKAGCRVFYGVKKLKVHAKMSVIGRKENDKIVNYVYLSTGNFNATTAKTYVDWDFLTVNEDFGKDVLKIFNKMTHDDYMDISTKMLTVAPGRLLGKFEQLILREIKNAKAGKSAKIILKVNNIDNKELIKLLYEASQAGVKIQLICRTICRLIPEVSGLSENIEIIQIIGRYLEHSRAYYFENNGDTEVYTGSSDWMNRNMEKRIETIWPVLDYDCKKQITDSLNVYLNKRLPFKAQDTFIYNAIKNQVEKAL